MDINLIWNNWENIGVVLSWWVSVYFLYKALKYDLPTGASIVWGLALGSIALSVFLTWAI